jgi:TonB family protein
MSVGDLSPMKQTMTIGLLPQRKFSYPTLFASFVLHIMLIIGLVHVGVIKPERVVVAARKLVYTPLVSTETSFARPQPKIKTYEPPVVAELVIPKLPPVSRPALVEPPKLKIKAEVPILTEAPVSLPKLAPQVQVGAFTPVKDKPTLPKSLPSEQVQTGGFGDPNGVKGHGDDKSKVTIASLGSFDMPSGAGYGNGTGGARGRAGIVASSGFDLKTDVTVSTAIVHTPVYDTGKPVEILGHDKPDYTEEGRKLGIQGEVLVRVRFAASGQVRVLSVVQGLGHGLDEQAERAAEKIRFKPAESNGQLVDSIAIVHVIFELAS